MLINKLLPNRLARRLVANLHPEWREEDNYGFLAFYDRCYFSAVRDLLDSNGFENLRFDFFIAKTSASTFSIRCIL